jgi:STE24 endopeptidase
MKRLRLGVASSAVEFAATAAFWLVVPAVWPGGGVFFSGAAYFATLAVLRQVLSLPIDYASGYRLAHEVGLSTETTGGWLGDRAKVLGLTLLIGGGVAGAFLSVMSAWPEFWWWIAAALGAAFAALMSLIGPVLLAPLFFRFKPLSSGELRGRLEKLLERTGARVRGGVWEMDMSRRTRAANAALVGWGPSRRVVLGDTLLDYGADEIEAILAHEIAHHVGRHIWLLLLGRGVSLAAGLYLAREVLLRPDLIAWTGTVSPAPGDPSAIGALWLLLSLWGALLSPLMHWVSRRLEFWCDRFAVRHTGGAGGMSSALAKLCRKNLADPAPPGWVVALFHSHPPLGERIRRAREAQKAGA